MATDWLFVRNPLLFEVAYTGSFKTIRYFFSCPSLFSSSTRLLRPLLLNLSSIEVTSKQQYVLLHRHNVSVHLKSSLIRPGSLWSCCLCFTQHVLGKKCSSISSESVHTVIWSQHLPFRSHFRSCTNFQLFLGKSRIQRICVHFQLFELVFITESAEQVVIHLKHSQFCVLKNEKT